MQTVRQRTEHKEVSCVVIVELDPMAHCTPRAALARPERCGGEIKFNRAVGPRSRDATAFASRACSRLANMIMLVHDVTE
jgi:hypothetical protein